MSANDEDFTKPLTDKERDSLVARLADSRCWLDAFKDTLTGPHLLRRKPGSVSDDDLEACPLADVTVVGRKTPPPLCHPVAKGMSREHFRVRNLGGICFIEDLDSSHHLYVNDQMVTRRRLVHGDRIRAGDVVFVFADG